MSSTKIIRSNKRKVADSLEAPAKRTKIGNGLKSPAKPDLPRRPEVFIASESCVSRDLPSLYNRQAPTKRAYGIVLTELDDTIGELEEIADAHYDEDGRQSTLGWTPKPDLDADDTREYIELTSDYDRLRREQDNLLDLVKHGVMKWVDCTHAQFVELSNTSKYYYYVNQEANEIMQKGCWQFASKELQNEHEQHFQERMVEYFYYGYPVYQHPKYEEYTDAALAIEHGCYAITDAQDFRKERIRIIKRGDKDRINAAIELYDTDPPERTECIAAFQRLFPDEHIMACMDDGYKQKCILAALIEKHN